MKRIPPQVSAVYRALFERLAVREPKIVLPELLAELEIKALSIALSYSHGCVKSAAQTLGITQRDFRQSLRHYGLKIAPIPKGSTQRH